MASSSNKKKTHTSGKYSIHQKTHHPHPSISKQRCTNRSALKAKNTLYTLSIFIGVLIALSTQPLYLNFFGPAILAITGFLIKFLVDHVTAMSGRKMITTKVVLLMAMFAFLGFGIVSAAPKLYEQALNICGPKQNSTETTSQMIPTLVITNATSSPSPTNIEITTTLHPTDKYITSVPGHRPNNLQPTQKPTNRPNSDEPSIPLPIGTSTIIPPTPTNIPHTPLPTIIPTDLPPIPSSTISPPDDDD